MLNYFVGILFLIIPCFAFLIIPEKNKGQLLTFCSAISIFFFFKSVFAVFFSGKSITFFLDLPFPIGHIPFVIDPLSAFFIMLISCGGFLALLYSLGYMEHYLTEKRPIGAHYLFIAVLIVSMVLVVTVQNMIAFLIVWEIMSLSSFFLVIYEDEKPKVFKASLNYFITMHIGSLFLLCGFIFLSIKTGSYDLASVKSFFTANPALITPVFLMFFTGFVIKAGFVPFHTWLPNAYTSAPNHVSALMSGIMSKTGIYGILRLVTLIEIHPAALGYLILFFSIISAITGIIYAMAQQDIKKALAYCSIENIGIIGLGMGTGLLGLAYHNQPTTFLGFSACILHIVNHAIFKQLLFFSAGAVYFKTHTRDLEQLGGLFKKMPLTGTAFLAGALSVSGMPPFNGFISKLLIYMSLLSLLMIREPVVSLVSVLLFAALAFCGALSIIAFTRAFGIVFSGTPRSVDSANASGDPGWLMLIPMGILGLLCVLIGLMPWQVLNMLIAPVQLLSRQADAINNLLFLKDLSFLLLLFIIIFIFIMLWRFILLSRKTVTTASTWGCGYQAPSPEMQYTAASFSAPFFAQDLPLVTIDKSENLPHGLFPRYGSFSTSVKSLIEESVFKYGALFIKELFGRFTWVQTGNTNKYILYGLIFLLITIIWLLVY
ncbi:MAG: proton-conducting transporter membrane subunit [Candidatus Margulisiibacteriota bacterium]